MWLFAQHFWTPVLGHMLPTCKLGVSRKRALIVLSPDVSALLKLAQTDVTS